MVIICNKHQLSELSEMTILQSNYIAVEAEEGNYDVVKSRYSSRGKATKEDVLKEIEKNHFKSNINTVMKKLYKYKNFGYALAIFFYGDLTVTSLAWVGSNLIERHQIQKQAQEILNTPDLTTGLEELELAVQKDLEDLEKNFSKKA